MVLGFEDDMIISASRRTDIPTYYSEWFLKRIKAGYVYVRNPMNPHQVSQINLSPEVVDGIVFWTKNSTPMLDRLVELNNYMYYFQFTLNSYGVDVEENIPNKSKVVIPAFQRLSDSIGPDRVIWRYDPIFLSKVYTVDYHIRYFEELAKRLSPYTKKCTISFLDLYRNTEKNIAILAPDELSMERQTQLAKTIAEIAHSYGLRIDTCAEEIDLSQYGIEHAKCIDDRLFSQLLQCPLEIKKDKNQRLGCGCVESVDIGAYNTCRNGCKYCYANYSGKAVCMNSRNHNPDSPLLSGQIGSDDEIKERKMFSYKTNQIQFDLL